MSVEVIISNQKFFNQLKNGKDFSLNTGDFTKNLVGSVGDKIKHTFDVSIRAFADSSSLQEFTISGTKTRLQRPYGSFLADGFSVGDTFNINVSPNTDNCTITAVSDTQIIYTGGNLIADGSYSNMSVYVTTPLTALVYNFGIIDNGATFSSKSNVSDNDQGLYAENIGFDTGGGARSTAWQEFTVKGVYLDWVSKAQGTQRAKWVSTDGTFYSTQKFSIEVEFIITPFYLERWASLFASNDSPQEFAGDASVKYALQVDFRSALSNPNTSKVGSHDDTLGSVAFFDENFNGFNNDYTVDSIAYTGLDGITVYDSVDLTKRTKFKAVLSTTGSAFSDGNTVFNVVMFRGSPEEDYQNTKTTDLEDNFGYDNVINTIGSAGDDGDNGVLFDVKGVINAGKLEITGEIDASSNAVIGDFYIIGIQVADHTLSSENSNKVLLRADYRAYTQRFINALVLPEQIRILQHPETEADQGISSGRIWVEDGVLVKFDFSVRREYNSIINRMFFDVMAYKNDSESFILETYEIPISKTPIIDSSGKQVLLVDTERVYPLNESDTFNDVRVQNEGITETKYLYSAVIGQKMSWQYWRANESAPTEFFNPALPQNGRNNKAYNYSDKQSYQIKFVLRVNATGDSKDGGQFTADFKLMSPDLEIYNYGQSTDWTAVVETLSPDAAVNYGGAIKDGADTRLRVTHTKSSAFRVGYNFWGINRLEDKNNGGDVIYEISSIVDPLEGIPLKPIDGESRLKITVDDIARTVICECLIDGSKLNSGQIYKLSSRIDDGKDSGSSADILLENGSPILLENGGTLKRE